jgi:hypothetical protein
MDMVRWILGPEWVLDITIYMMNVVVMVRWTLDPEHVVVITIKFVGTLFLHDSISLLFLLSFGHGLSFSFFLFFMP